MQSTTVCVVVLCALLAATSVQANAVARAEALLSQTTPAVRADVRMLLHTFLTQASPALQAQLRAEFTGVKTTAQCKALLKTIEGQYPGLATYIEQAMAGAPKSITPVHLFHFIGSLTNADMQAIEAYLGTL
jgi:hypothetical protein